MNSRSGFSRTSAPSSRRLRWTLWALVAALVLLAVLWPWVRDAVLLSDDAEMLFVRFGVDEFHVWSTSQFFRPLDVLAATMVDKETRSLGPALWLHVPSVVAVGFAMRAALRRLGAGPVALPAALTWLVLSVATLIVWWQPDIVSQTAAAAVGSWLLLVVWRATDSGGGGRGQLLAVFGLTVLLLLTREQWLGWVGAAGLLTIGRLVMRRRGAATSAAPASRLVRVLAIVALPAMLFLAARLLTSPLGDVVFGGATMPGGRYDLRLGVNVLRNLLLIGLGVTSVGPAHMVDMPYAVPVARIAPVVGSLLTVGSLALAVLRRGHLDVRVLAVVVLPICSVLPSVPSGTISEYYLFGANLGVAVGVGLGVERALALARRGRGAKALFGLAGVATVLIGVLGVASRAAHVDRNWSVVRTIVAAVGTVQADEPTTVVYPREWEEGPTHGVFVSTPEHLYDMELSGRFLRRSGIPITFSPGRPPAGSALDIDLPDRLRW